MSEVTTLTPDRIVSQHVVRTALADGQQLVVLTGVLVVNCKGAGDEWAPCTVRAAIPITGLAAGQTFTAAQWAPAVSIAAADQDAAADNPGWAVDGFELVEAGAASDHVTLDVRAAVRNPSCFLLRVSYQITLVGTAS